MARRSRLQAYEERKSKRKGFFLLVLTVAFLIFLFKYGIAITSEFVSLITDFQSGSSSVPVAKDETPPAPPHIDPLPEFSNKKEIEVTGRAEPDTTLFLKHNDKVKEIAINSQGEFSLQISLVGGENSFKAWAKDNAGNEGQENNVQVVVYDTNKPDLLVSSPQNGANFFGEQQRNIEIVGTTEPEAQIQINERIAVVDDDGGFRHTTRLEEGENSFTVVSQDKAGNTTELSFVVSLAL